jgi:uncharacterized membrane protein
MIKTMTFAIVHFTVAFTVAWLLTGDVVIGGLVALVEPMVNTVAYFFHEKVWERVRKGQDTHHDGGHDGALMV